MTVVASEESKSPDLDAVRDELYGLLPDAFVAARTAAEKAARSAGDRETAAAIKALGKPTVVAWLANQLVRTHRDEVTPLLELGAALREATRSLSGEQLRTLSQQQNQVILALVRQGRKVARAAGQQVTEATAAGLEETLRAALADEELAEQLATGQLTAGLQFVGFGLMGGTSPERARPVKAPPRKAPAKGGKTSERDKAAERRAAELRKQLEEAAEAVDAARAGTEQAFDVERHARSTRDDARAAARTTGEEVDALRAQLAEAQSRADDADRAADEATQQYDAASEALEQARATLTAAEQHQRELQDG